MLAVVLAVCAVAVEVLQATLEHTLKKQLKWKLVALSAAQWDMPAVTMLCVSEVVQTQLDYIGMEIAEPADVCVPKVAQAEEVCAQLAHHCSVAL